jgi:hypothetical protein
MTSIEGPMWSATSRAGMQTDSSGWSGPGGAGADGRSIRESELAMALAVFVQLPAGT